MCPRSGTVTSRAPGMVSTKVSRPSWRGEPVARTDEDRRRHRDRGDALEQIHRAHGLHVTGAYTRIAVGEQRAGQIQLSPCRIDAERAPYEAKTVGRAHGPRKRGRAHEASGDAVGLRQSPARIGRGGGHQHNGSAPLVQHLGLEGGQGHHGHATHGMTGQDRIGDVSGLEDEGEVAGQRGGVERGGPPGRCAVSALVVEHDPVAGLDQTAGDGDPHSVAGGPAVGEHHGWAAPDVPHGEASTVGRRDGDLTRWFELAPAQILEPIGSSADLRPGLTAGLGAPVGDGTRGGNGRRAAQDDEATMSK